MQGQISEHIVAAKLRLLCLLSIGFKNWGISSDIRPRDAFRPIALERKYLMGRAENNGRSPDNVRPD